MFNPKEINQKFGKVASQYEEHADLQRLVREECLTMAQEVFRPGSHILDLGCGTGALSKEIRQRGLDWQVTQADLSLGMCKVARDTNPANINITVNAAADALPFADGSFDGVFSSLMLQWVYDPLPIMREIARVTKPGSPCLIATLTHGTLHELQESFAKLDSARHVNAFAAPAPLTALCVHGGFTMLACEEETFTTYYPDVTSLMRSLKSIGASSLQEKRRPGMMTPRQMEALEKEYWERFGMEHEDRSALPATWQVLYMLLERE